MQQYLRKIKFHFDKKALKKSYPIESWAGLVYSISKLHKRKTREGLKKLTLSPTIYDIVTTMYETLKYLNALLTPFGKFWLYTKSKTIFSFSKCL